MTKDYYTVDQISEMLDIHPKTIQRYIREGKLHATKIGKSWRVTGHDLSIFVQSNGNETTQREKQQERKVIASSVIDIAAFGKEDAMRIMNTLTAASNAKPPGHGQSSIQSQYIERENMVRITLWGDIGFMAVMMDTVASLTQG